jgi:hypothetical protein
MKHCCNKAADDDDKTSNLLDSNKGKDKETRMCCCLRMSMLVLMGAMAMTVEVMVTKVMDVARSQQGTEEGEGGRHNTNT